MDAMESFHSNSAKLFQGLTSNTANIGSIGTMGWTSMRAIVDTYRLMFLWRVLWLPMTCIYKRMMLQRVVECMHYYHCKGPVWEMVECCRRYDLTNFLVEAVMNGVYVTVSQWKNLVKTAVSSDYMRSYKITCMLYKSLDIMDRDKVKPQMLPWWEYAKLVPQDSQKCRLLCNLLLNSYRLGYKLCPLCGLGTDGICHILFNCSILDHERATLWRAVCEKAPRQLCRELNAMPRLELCKFVLNGFYCNFTPEWKDLYRELIRFVYLMYTGYVKQVKLE